MAQLLILDRDNFAPPGQSDELEFKTGDVVAVAEDSHTWGAAEIVAPFRIVSKPGPRADYAYLLEDEPAQLRHNFPRSHFGRRQSLLTSAITQDYRQRPGRPRRHYLDLADNIIRKPIERN